MTTGEWIATLIASNTFTLCLATYISNVMIKKSESGAKVANDIRDATIEKIRGDHDSLEKEVVQLTSNIGELKEIVTDKTTSLIETKKDITRLKAVVLSHGRKQKRLLQYIESQEKEVVTLENSILRLAEKLGSVNEMNTIALLEFKRELVGATRSVELVKRTVNKLKKEAESSQEQRSPFLLR